MTVRTAARAEVDALCRIWHEGWHDAHASIVPEELTRARTLERFTERMARAIEEVRVVGELGAPAGFTMLKDDELDQLYVAREARGSGVAAELIAEAEERLRERGVARAWLACAIGNERAARFYEKRGWTRTGIVVSRLQIPTGIFLLDVWRYEKALG
jgi:GNAT superfamily N-acetyltransferase